METYIETILRYRVCRVEKLPREHAAEYRLNGIETITDPVLGEDCTMSLIFSFKDEATARDCAEGRNKDNTARFWRYVMIDGGKEDRVERSVMF